MEKSYIKICMMQVMKLKAKFAIIAYCITHILNDNASQIDNCFPLFLEQQQGYTD